MFQTIPLNHHFKAKTAANRDVKEKKDNKDKKSSDTRKPGCDTRKPAESDRKESREEVAGDKGGSEEDNDQEEGKPDEKNVVFCMWGHENCKTR